MIRHSAFQACRLLYRHRERPNSAHSLFLALSIIDLIQASMMVSFTTYLKRADCRQHLQSPTHTDYASLYISVCVRATFTRVHPPTDCGTIFSFRSVTVCHFILHLRQVYLDGTNTSTTASSSSAIQFASQVVGNLGAPLDLSRRFDEEDSIVRDPLTMSSNPLAAGLPVEDRPLVHSCVLPASHVPAEIDNDAGHLCVPP